jgi:plasmid stabilization system protein ParE
VAHTIHVHPRAYADIRNATGRIQQLVSPASATRWHDGVWAKMRSLATLPEMWPLADEAADLGLELREVLYGHRHHVYRILFTIDGQTVNIHRVRHAAQDRLTTGDV